MSEKASEDKKTIDATGYVCPYPAMLTLDALKELPAGGVLEVTVDNPPSVENISHKVESKGYKVEKVDEIGEKLWKITMSKQA
ncbi:hypothetical protein AKJ45_02670 [candidate division MSBL1 archaeon SCGC-AAA261F19]|uniref:UPF0033 domain-containing protein n=1 Tax=candidate division MSBL1 archaeon SCGC-AAA261F19 TaxID=1698275 RepID=A0A133V9D6_9EURY|nr:hypothetical protein AKJ45_02670 [candidate division MSBL1 archaeon SCGC-AAA261F19]